MLPHSAKPLRDQIDMYFPYVIFPYVLSDEFSLRSKWWNFDVLSDEFSLRSKWWNFATF